jgi:hypothetical protein
MTKTQPTDRTIVNIERAGTSLGWSGWEIRGAQAASILLFSHDPELRCDRDLNECQLRQFGRRLAQAMEQQRIPAHRADVS